MKNLLWGLLAFSTLSHAQGTVTDIDGNTYDYLTYGTQQWTVENAAMETYRDGTPIPQVTDVTQWTNLTTGAWCYYDNDPTKGKLYNWFALAGIHDTDPNTPNKEFAPMGWHVPLREEYIVLSDFLIESGYNYDNSVQGNKIGKAMSSISGWDQSSEIGDVGNNQVTNNSSGFNITPIGIRNASTAGPDPWEYRYQGLVGRFWTSDDGAPGFEVNEMSAVIGTGNTVSSLNGVDSFGTWANKKYGHSVRFVRNVEACSEFSIDASTTDVCAGESVDLTVSSGTTSFVEGSLIGELNHTITTNIEQNFATQIGLNYRLEITGNFSWGTYCPNLAWDPAYTLTGFYGAQEPTPREMLCDSGVYSSIFCDTPGLRPNPDVYDDLDHTYNYYFVANSNSINVGFQDGNALGDNCGTIRYRLYENSIPTNSSTYTWSTGDTTENIIVTPTETTEYWVDVTTNGVTCREYVTINVTAPAAPTGDAEQTFCTTSTVADLTATGDNIQWYDAATGGNLLNSTTVLTDGQMVYASQTVNGCESTDRLEVSVSIQEITITASATEVCAGESVDLSVNVIGSNFSNWGNGEPNNCCTEFGVEQFGMFWLSTGLWNDGPDSFTDANCIMESEVNLGSISNFTFIGVYDSHFYYSFNDTNNWTYCNNLVESLGGYLAIIDSQSESEFILSNMSTSYDRAWIGMFQDTNHPSFSEPEGAWFWVDGTPVAMSSNSIAYTWSTGDTSAYIFVSPTETAEYWVDVNSNGVTCREYITITVNDLPATPVSGGDITECETIAAQSLVATASANTGESITWYDAATGGNIVADPSLSAAGTVTYYAEATNDTSGCASLTRTAVTLTITSIAAPTGDAVQSFCDNVTVSDLSALGSNIQWYYAATGGNVLDPSSALSDGQLLYASQTQNGCESITRLEVSVEIDIIPNPILITTELEFCLAREATLADLEVDEQGFELEWYDSFSGGNMLPMDTLLEDGVSYYATLYDAVSGCESLLRLEVVPTVIPCEVIIYNAISLNDNGINDYMVIENAEYFPDNSLEVYNRDGHLLYSQTQYGIGDNLFRGVANVSGIYGSTASGDGSRLPTGSYLYVFKYFNPYEQQQYTLKGFLTINSN